MSRSWRGVLGFATAAVLAVSAVSVSSVVAAPVAPRTPLCIEVPDATPGDVAVINITNTAATGPGYGALRASDATPIPLRPVSEQFSSVNFAPGPANPNLALVTIGTDRRFCYDSDGATAHVLLDLVATIPAASVNNIEPERLVDTRTTGRPIAPGNPLCIVVPDGMPGDVAVVNITNTAATGVGYGALRSSDAAPVPSRPPAAQFSSVNFAPGPANPNLAFVTIGADRRFCYDSGNATAHVLLDLAATIPAEHINNIEPTRLVDTRNGRGPVAPRTPLCVAVPDGAPGAVAVVTITNTAATGPGYGALRSSDAAPVPSRPTADQFSSVNFAPGPANPNLAFVTIGTDGQFCYDSDGATAHVILDLAATIPANSIDSTEPQRLIDTRTTGGNDNTALELLATIPVRNETPTGYDRNLFNHWVSQGNGCDTRDRVLIDESLTNAQVSYPGCVVLAGDWYSSFDNVTTSDPTDLDIDHLVPLKEAWDSGAINWTASQREAFANDLDDNRALIAVTASSNRSKGAADPSNWIPPHQPAVCGYLEDWVAVKVRWQLSMDSSEHGRVRNLLNDCPTRSISPVTVVNVTTTPPPPAPPPDTNCDASYPTVCIPPPPPDLDCADITFRNFVVLQPDPHRFDGNNDGIGCTS